jgi:hypothetical protein
MNTFSRDERGGRAVGVKGDSHSWVGELNRGHVYQVANEDELLALATHHVGSMADGVTRAG